MKNLLINVSYTDDTNKFWADSYIKNMIVEFNPENETIHELVKNLCAEKDGMELSYNGKPQGNVYCDDKNGEAIRIGYMYRGKIEIYDRNMTKPQRGLFDVWVTIREVNDFKIEQID